MSRLNGKAFYPATVWELTSLLAKLLLRPEAFGRNSLGLIAGS